jgi:AcrR family transcriptional regulator
MQPPARAVLLGKRRKVLAVVARHGLEAASLRNVADEAHLAIGSVRHYFDGHDDLIIFATQELNRRIAQRVWPHTERILDSLATAGGRDERRLHSEELLAEWLPLDEVRHQEAVPGHLYRSRPNPPAATPHAQALHEVMSTIVHRVLSEAKAADGLPRSVDVGLETVRLCAVPNGLSGQVALSGQPPQRPLRDVLHHHLNSLS